MTEQLQYAAEHHKIGQCKQIAALLSSAPGQFHRRKRRLLYELLGLGESARASQVAPFPLPPLLEEWQEPELGAAG